MAATAADPVIDPSLGTFAGELLADRDYWRSRCPVEPEDIASAGVTWKHVQAWARVNPGAVRSHDMSRPSWARDRPEQMVRLIIAHVNGGATWSKFTSTPRCAHDILEEMAAMPVGKAKR